MTPAIRSTGPALDLPVHQLSRSNPSLDPFFSRDQFVMHSGPLATDELVTVSHGMTSRAAIVFAHDSRLRPMLLDCEHDSRIFCRMVAGEGCPPSMPPNTWRVPTNGHGAVVVLGLRRQREHEPSHVLSRDRTAHLYSAAITTPSVAIMRSPAAARLLGRNF